MAEKGIQARDILHAWKDSRLNCRRLSCTPREASQRLRVVFACSREAEDSHLPKYEEKSPPARSTVLICQWIQLEKMMNHVCGLGFYKIEDLVTHITEVHLVCLPHPLVSYVVGRNV